MPPSRRQVLRSGALSLAALGGCVTGGGSPTTDGRPPTETTVQPMSTSTRTEPETTRATPSSVRCGLGSLPETDWPLPERSLGRTNYAPGAAGPTNPTAAWAVTATDPEVGEVEFTRPVVADGRVFVGRRIVVGPEQPLPDEHHVEAYDAETGERLWRTSISSRPYSPSITGSTVLVHDDETLYALDAASGAKQWTADLSLRVHSILPTPDGILMVAYGDDTGEEALVSYDSDGRENGRTPVPVPMIGSNLAWANHRAYLATIDAKLVAFDTVGGTVAWTRNLQDGDDTAPARLAATPCAALVAIDGVLYAVTRDGVPAWSIDASVRELAIDGETVYGLDGSGYVRALAVADGTQRWERFFGVEDWRHTDGFYDDPSVGAETLFAGTLDGKLLAVSTADGSERWAIERDWEGEAIASVVDDTLYTAWGRHLVAYR